MQKMSTDVQAKVPSAMRKMLPERAERSQTANIDFDRFVNAISEQMPVFDNEALYILELEHQRKINIAMMVLGAIMVGLALLLRVNGNG